MGDHDLETANFYTLCHVEVSFGMLPSMTPADASATSLLGGSPEGPRRKEGGRSIFDFPKNEEEFLKDGEETAQYVRDMLSRLRTEGAEVSCRAVVLGTSSDHTLGQCSQTTLCTWCGCVHYHCHKKHYPC